MRSTGPPALGRSAGIGSSITPTAPAPWRRCWSRSPPLVARSTSRTTSSATTAPGAGSRRRSRSGRGRGSPCGCYTMRSAPSARRTAIGGTSRRPAPRCARFTRSSQGIPSTSWCGTIASCWSPTARERYWAGCVSATSGPATRRGTMVGVCGPGAAALDRAFARIWRRAGGELPSDEPVTDPEPCGTSIARMVEGVPGQARVYRAVQLLAAAAAERLWITDAYLIAPPPLYASLLDAARDGVDVRVLVPGTSDLPVLRNFTRVGYRELLRAGVRIFEYQGPMIHAKTMLVDHRWARVGSSNLNVSSLLTNYELDLVAECEELTRELAAQFRRDLAASREIVLRARRVPLPPRLVGAPATGRGDAAVRPGTRHKRSGYELGAVAVVALRRVAGGLRRAIAVTAALTLAGVGGLLLAFPRIMSIVLATGTFWLAIGFGLYALERRRTREPDDD